MSFWSAIVAIVAILAWAKMRSARYEAGLGHPLAELRNASRPDPALEREVIELRKRVEVLERILTDGRDASRLAQDIEALREH
ncbi:hypothetical protein [Novosphingobium sp.]|uniref:hypothetical protein n=1 Tax=Novosphingobium sp. TaxID=1874826 RepID=UPI00260BDDB6|nr:hypothetical protein [Novosphingobium sp.]